MKAAQRDMIWNAIFGAMSGASFLLALASFMSGRLFSGVAFALATVVHAGLCAWAVVDYDEEDT